MSEQRMTPSEFKAEYRRRGWSGKDLAARWNKHPNSLSRIVNDPLRDLHWDDAVRGLEQKTNI
ncbi:hypothetical protein RTH46_09010 [Pseudomonas sp. zfem004]|uniref:hypothetical protein n=1 Tax=Pseudomonas sp. zfem004 TaxID=3078199 RepID=UPI00292932A8|nr:hypothetical protein [Pseudomonas sp. zfem004]MDU9402630.1 hypothetical protein [Pseudomonas sp. zfem004]